MVHLFFVSIVCTFMFSLCTSHLVCVYLSCFLLVLVLDYQLSSNSGRKVPIHNDIQIFTFYIYNILKNVDILVILHEITPPLIKIPFLLDIDATI
jgi:hypothetical protein